MMAPRRLQSLGATVQAVATAVSSALSTSSVVGGGINRLKVEAAAHGTAVVRLDELEDALGAYSKDAPTKTASVKSVQTTFLFIVYAPT
jgi:hypothetical protein